MQMYVNDNGAYTYYYYDYGPILGETVWQKSLLPYDPVQMNWTNHNYHCPSYNGPIVYDPGGFSSGSYSYNTYGAANTGTALSSSQLGLGLYNYDGGSFPSPRREAQIVAPSETFAYLDSRGRPNPATGLDVASGLPANVNPSLFSFAVPPQHGTVFNVLCCDVHVESVRLMDLFNPTNTAHRWNIDHEPHPEYWQNY